MSYEFGVQSFEFKVRDFRCRVRGKKKLPKLFVNNMKFFFEMLLINWELNMNKMVRMVH